MSGSKDNRHNPCKLSHDALFLSLKLNHGLVLTGWWAHPNCKLVLNCVGSPRCSLRQKLQDGNRISPLLHWLTWERNWVRTHRSVSWHVVDCVGSLFSQEQWLYSPLSMTHEKLPRTGTACRKCTPGVRRLAWKMYVSCWSKFPLQSAHWFESPRLSNMSNRLFVTAVK
jgi:hypothetical protein